MPDFSRLRFELLDEAADFVAVACQPRLEIVQLAGEDSLNHAGDYAILLLLARLGLRSGEVVAMTLDDLDWDRGEIVVRGKGQRLARLPLLADVGTALANYLRHDRPACPTRRVFVRSYAPHTGWLGGSPIRAVVYAALARAGLNPLFKGSHLLRHSLATDLLRRGASLLEIGQVLRHSQPATTQTVGELLDYVHRATT